MTDFNDGYEQFDNDDFSGIFDDLTPEMFAFETSCVDETRGNFKGVAAFNATVDERLRGVRAAFATSFGQINPVAVLTNSTTQRVFTPQQDENLGHFLERLKREAVMMSAHWFFIAKKNVFAIWYDDDETDSNETKNDVSSPEALENAAQKGSEPEIGILWYAERREGDEAHSRQGVLKIEGNRLVSVDDADETQTNGVFSLILDAVIH